MGWGHIVEWQCKTKLQDWWWLIIQSIIKRLPDKLWGYWYADILVGGGGRRSLSLGVLAVAPVHLLLECRFISTVGVMLFESLAIQRRVIWSLFLRELKTRFGKYRLGYIWAVLEPLVQMGLLFLVFGFVMRRLMPEISFLVFLINGIYPWMLFSKIALRSVSAIEANQGLLSYRPVRVIDTLLARVLLESLIVMVTYALTLFFLHTIGESFTLNRFLEIGVVFGLVILLATGLGCLFMVIGQAFPETEKILPMLLSPLYFISGIMFSPSMVPVEYRWLIDWNPMLHAMELLRHYEVPTYHTMPGVSLTYLAFSALVVLALGMIAYKGREPAMMTS